jgi:ABC-2 type transport system ATP-binding protein
MTNSPAIQTHGLSKSYKNFAAVSAVNLTVLPNRITAFLGLNGAGKSTTIKMLLGMLQPTAGEGTVLGHQIDEEASSIEMRKKVAYVSENKRLYDYMTVAQMVRFTSGFYGDWRPEMAESLLRKFQLPLHRKVKSLSKGMRTKLALLLAFARWPELIILDEPSEGLDPVGVEQLLETIVAHSSEGATIFFSSHQIDEVERIADDVCVLDKGRLVMNVMLDELRRSYRRIELVFPSPPKPAGFQIMGVEGIRTQGNQMSIFASCNADAVVELARGFDASSIDVRPVGLREIFLQKVRED